MPAALTLLAKFYADQGRFRDAEALLEDAIAHHPDSPEAWSGIPHLRKMRTDDAAWLDGALRTAEKALPPRQEARLRFAIGKYFDDVQEYPRAFEQLLAGLSWNAERVVDKMPVNFMSLGLIHAALPEARFIHIRRNPGDTCLSLYFQDFDASYSFANDLEHLVHYYGEYARVMAHWRSMVPTGRMLEVSYEALVDDHESWARSMVEFVGLEWDPVCLDFHETQRTINTASNWQVRQKVNKSSVERWRNYESLVGPLKGLTESTR